MSYFKINFFLFDIRWLFLFVKNNELIFQLNISSILARVLFSIIKFINPFKSCLIREEFFDPVFHYFELVLLFLEDFKNWYYWLVAKSKIFHKLWLVDFILINTYIYFQQILIEIPGQSFLRFNVSVQKLEVVKFWVFW